MVRMPALFVVASRLVAIAAIVVVLSILSPHFLSWGNFVNVLRQASLQFLIASGLTIVVLTGGIDLAVGAILGLAACLSASLISEGHLAWGIVAGLLAALACGSVSGVLVTWGRIPAFIATYGMLWIAHGLGYVFMEGEVIYGLPQAFRFLGAGFIGPIPVPVVVAVVLMLLLHWMLHGTVLGRFHPTGIRPKAADRLAVYGISLSEVMFMDQLAGNREPGKFKT